MRALSEVRLRESDRLAVQEAARLLRERFPVDNVLLFGSKARGEDDPESDIDLLVLTSRPLARAERHALLAVLYPLQLQLDVVLSPLVVHTGDWNEGLVSVLPIRREIERDGVLV